MSLLKKVLVVAMSAVFVVTILLTGCTTALTSGTTAAAAETTAAAAAETTAAAAETTEAASTKAPGDITLGLSQWTLGNDFYKGLQESAISRAAELGVKDLIATDANLDVNKQIADIEDLLTKGVDGLIINPQDTLSLLPVISKAKEMGVFVVTVDNRIDDAAEVDCSILANNFKSGVAVGEWLAAKMKGTPMKIALISGAEGSEVGMERRMGMLSGIAEEQLRSQGQVNFEVVAQGYTGWTIEGSIKAMEDIVTAHPEFNCMVSEADGTAVWAKQVTDDMGWEDQYPIIGALSDFTGAQTRPLTLEGRMASGFQSPYLFGELGVEILLKFLNGEFYPRYHYLPIITITSENVDEVYDENGNYKPGVGRE
jgi:ribose transport system substrate-binding protein